MSPISRAQLDTMAEEATVDCYNEAEQLTSFFTMIHDNVAVPFETLVLGMSVVVEDVDQTDDGQIVALCRRGQHQQSIPKRQLR